MIKKQQILDLTDNGLDIILHYYPEASKTLSLDEKSNRYVKGKFSIRKDEQVPSCMLVPPNSNGNNSSDWKVKDFGSGKYVSGFDICIEQEPSVESFSDAVVFLANLFHVASNGNVMVNAPRIEKRKPTEKERKEGTIFKLLSRIPDEHIKLLGPGVKREHADELNWFEAEYVGTIGKDDMLTIRYSTESYPILMRRCYTGDIDNQKDFFYKQYEPLNADKGSRFKYVPTNGKQKDYINGYYELCKAYELANIPSDEELLDELDEEEPKNDDVPKKLPYAVICSGERDAITCLAHGGRPVWFNSETSMPTKRMIADIYKKVHIIYNIPDIDDTGLRCGKKLALEYMTIRTVWLPDSLRDRLDARHNPCKDFRDYMELPYDQRLSFEELLTKALPACFWSIDSSAHGRKSIDIESVCLFYFLELHGFYRVKDDIRDTQYYVHKEGNIIREVKSCDVRQFVREWVETQNFSNSPDFLTRVRINTTLRSKLTSTFKMSDAMMENLSLTTLNYSSYTIESQFFCFLNGIVEVTADDIIFHGKNYQGDVIFNIKDVIPHNYVEDIDETTGKQRRYFCVSDDYSDIEVLDKDCCPLFGYEINTCRIYWRDEMVKPFMEDLKRIEAYRASHKFIIDSPSLTQEQIRDQKRSLISHMYARGYLMYERKIASMARSVICLDHDVSRDGNNNGRSGKSLFVNTILNDKEGRYDYVSGRDNTNADNKHIFERVNRDVKVVFFDDFENKGDLSRWFDAISANMVINPKGTTSYVVKYEDSPKIVFTTNGVPFNFDGSSMARIFPITFSSYYHQMATGNDHLDNYTPSMEFGFEIEREGYPEELYEADFRYKMQCLQLHLQMLRDNVLPDPPMETIIERKESENLDKFIVAFAERFVSTPGNLDIKIKQDDLYNLYIENVAQEHVRTRNKFTRDFKQYCNSRPDLIYNPASMVNDNKGRISDGKDIYIYLKSIM